MSYGGGTCNSFISFSSSDTPVVIRVLTNGLKAENPNQPVVKWLETQLAEMRKLKTDL